MAVGLDALPCQESGKPDRQGHDRPRQHQGLGVIGRDEPDEVRLRHDQQQPPVAPDRLPQGGCRDDLARAVDLHDGARLAADPHPVEGFPDHRFAQFLDTGRAQRVVLAAQQGRRIGKGHQPAVPLGDQRPSGPADLQLSKELADRGKFDVGSHHRRHGAVRPLDRFRYRDARLPAGEEDIDVAPEQPVGPGRSPVPRPFGRVVRVGGIFLDRGHRTIRRAAGPGYPVLPIRPDGPLGVQGTCRRALHHQEIALRIADIQGCQPRTAAQQGQRQRLGLGAEGIFRDGAGEDIGGIGRRLKPCRHLRPDAPVQGLDQILTQGQRIAPVDGVGIVSGAGQRPRDQQHAQDRDAKPYDAAEAVVERLRRIGIDVDDIPPAHGRFPGVSSGRCGSIGCAAGRPGCWRHCG